MKGLSSKVSGHKPGMWSASKVPSASNLRGQGAKASSTKVSNTAGFGASRKKGSIKGC